ncbi:MAG: CpXC domain-containing protein [Lachnospiraceae bacterium]|nr:CpXC domain-containing protein [Lachnospiraceae bacterium]
MSEFNTQKTMCPECGRTIEFDAWESIEIPYDGEQKEKVMDNTFFRVSCSHCRISFPIAYPCKYNDLEQRYLIWIAPKLDEKEQAAIAAHNHKLKNDAALRLAQNAYTFRIVRNSNELREKIRIFDEGLDDRILETLKLVYVPSIRKQIGAEAVISGLYFDKHPKSGEYQWVVLVAKREPLVGKIDMSVYEDMKEKMGALIEEKTGEGLVRIDARWATDVMMEYNKRKQMDSPKPPAEETDL